MTRAFDWWDAALVAGIAILTAGLWLLSPAAALVELGAVLIFAGIRGGGIDLI